MARLLTQVQGRQALKQVLHNTTPSLARYSVEPSRVKPFGVFTNAVFQNEAAFSRLSNLYNVFTPCVAGMLPREIPFAFSLRYFNHFAKQNPWKVGFTVASAKAVLADIFAQKVIEKKESWDAKRTGLFFGFGALYSGIICTSLYSFAYPAIFISRLKSLNALGAVITDNIINVPVIMLPILCVLKECLMKSGSLKDAWIKYKNEFVESVILCWKIWIPAHVVTFGFVPVHLRMPFVSAISFIYYTAISLQQTMFEQRLKNEELSVALDIQ